MAQFGGSIASLNSAKVEGRAISTPPSSVTLIHTTISGNTTTGNLSTLAANPGTSGNTVFYRLRRQ